MFTTYRRAETPFEPVFGDHIPNVAVRRAQAASSMVLFGKRDIWVPTPESLLSLALAVFQARFTLIR